MRFIQEFGFTVKVGQEEAHQQWMEENEEKYAKAHPEGGYLGTFATVFSTDKQSGLPIVHRAGQLRGAGSAGGGVKGPIVGVRQAQPRVVGVRRLRPQRAVEPGPVQGGRGRDDLGPAKE